MTSKRAHLATTIDRFDELRPAIKAQLAAWSSGDVGALKSVETYSAVSAQATMTVARNRAWLPTIEAADDCLVVVGALHLVGDGSVLYLLARDGFTVTRIQ